MAAKPQTYQPLPREDATAALLSPSDREDREDERKPIVKATFPPVLLLRLLVIPFSITNTVLMSQTWDDRGVAIFFCVISSILSLWTTLQIINGIFNLTNSMGNTFEIKIKSFFCSCGIASTGYSVSKNRSWYLVNLVDFFFCIFFIIPGSLSLEGHIWRYSLHASVGGVCITVASIQLAIAVLALFSVFRKATIVIYKAETDDQPAYTIEELYRDDMSEPRDSMSERRESTSSEV
ncbi:hypothetical protein FALBO_6872 [Fusarium albosuccineum]|uniref:Uncharacterized protein n=1 Tax=Fusarium albosuccineum TaxID=1237068 RepID=A0A8H4PE90_9HYPO|nr:hypothetical protein FALBO_6872 [Fusarium albosuccineum]